MADELGDADIEMDGANLYREETFTDRRVGTLQRLTPVTATGDQDPARTVIYVGQTQVLTPAGALPLTFEVPAATLEEAVKVATHPGTEANWSPDGTKIAFLWGETQSCNHIEIVAADGSEADAPFRVRDCGPAFITELEWIDKK